MSDFFEMPGRVVGFELHRINPTTENRLKCVRYEGHAVFRKRGLRGLFAQRVRVLVAASNDQNYVVNRLRQCARVNNLPQTYRKVHR